MIPTFDWLLWVRSVVLAPPAHLLSSIEMLFSLMISLGNHPSHQPRGKRWLEYQTWTHLLTGLNSLDCSATTPSLLLDLYNPHPRSVWWITWTYQLPVHIRYYLGSILLGFTRWHDILGYQYGRIFSVWWPICIRGQGEKSEYSILD